MSEEYVVDSDAGNSALDELLTAAAEEMVESSSLTNTIQSGHNTQCDDISEKTSGQVVDSSCTNLSSITNKENESNFDSSDDEDLKNFLEKKYNEYGCDINKQLKQQMKEKHEAKVAKEVSKLIDTNTSDVSLTKANSNWSSIKNPHKPKIRHSEVINTFRKSKSIEHSIDSSFQTKIHTPKSQATSAVFVDPVFGLRLINPLISSDLLTERMGGRTLVRFSGIPFHIERGDLSKDWVIAGVLVSKSSVKTSTNGSLYSIWKLSDLTGDIKMVSLFLFKSAHKDLWKTSTGMAIAVLNATIFEKRSHSDIACLSIDASQKVMVLGNSKDFGQCKAKKKNGEPCSSTINLSDGEFCIYHIKQEFSKLSRRGEFQSPTAGRGLNDLRTKILGKSGIAYGGQFYSAIPAKNNPKLLKKDSLRLKSLSERVIPSSSNIIENEPITHAAQRNDHPKLGAKLETTVKANFIQNKYSQLSNLETSKLRCITPPSIEFSFQKNMPPLSKELFSLKANISENKANIAKYKAMQIIKQNPIQKSNPNFIKYRGTVEGKKKAVDDLKNEFDDDAKRQKLDKEQKDNDRKSRIQRIIDATSSHQNLLISRDMQEQDKYFNNLEKKEALEEKMLNTYKIPCKAVVCIKCKYTAFSAADRCKEEKHPLKIIDTEKRFFQCKDCKNRTITVQKFPKFSCNNCKSSRWERAAMIRERKVVNNSESLSIRGDEETFIGSLAGASNINLLVPDEDE